MTYRFASDTGGTFTDLIVEEVGVALSMYKAATTPSDPVMGVLDALELAAKDKGVPLSTLLGDSDLFIHGTTHAINAIVTGNTAKTAFLTTEGHPDVLTIREGGRSEPFNYTIPYPAPYIPRALTFEVPERVAYDGSIVKALDKNAVISILKELKEQDVEAVAVSLLWSVSNSDHEKVVGELIEEYLPGVPFTLSHELNPCVREYRRASSASIDASLKPLMTKYLGSLTSRIEAAGFKGNVLVLTSQGGTIDAQLLANHPIHAVNSGPSMAPLGGRYAAQSEGFDCDVMIADTGGTTYDVSLVRGGVIPWSTESWIGAKFQGHMTGFPSIDVQSIGSGGGSIAWVDAGGMLHMGPKSAGSVPGPVCYGNGGTEPTFTDACLVLGFLDKDYFLGGTQDVDLDAAEKAIMEKVGKLLGLGLKEAAFAMVDVITENMVQAINDITVSQGISPSDAVLIGGGGAAGFNSIWIAERLGCKNLIVPALSPALSASGALISDLTADYRHSFFTISDNFDYEGVSKVLTELKDKCVAYRDSQATKTLGSEITVAVEARYESQVWEIEVPINIDGIASEADLSEFLERFHEAYKRIYAVNDPSSSVEFVNWIAQIRCKLRESEELPQLLKYVTQGDYPETRRAYLPESKAVIDVPLYQYNFIDIDTDIRGPAIIESSWTTTVVNADSTFKKSKNGNIVIKLD